VPMPDGIGIGTGAVLVVAATFVAAALPAGCWFVLLATVVGAVATSLRPRAAIAVAGIAFLLADGFLVGRFGELAWHGPADLARLGLLLAAAGSGAAAGAVRQGIHVRAGLHALERFANRTARAALVHSER
jgi:hypothetical protein